MATVESAEVLVTLGIDTHLDRHVAVALDQFGRRLGVLMFPTTPDGHSQLESWAYGFGTLTQVGMEGTGSLGAGLARWLGSRGHSVLEVNRPDRQARRRAGKSDPLDAEAAARAAQAGTVVGSPKSGDGQVEMIRALRVARRSAVKARTQAANQLHALVVTAPDELRSSLRKLGIPTLVATASRWRAGNCPNTPLAATRFAMKSIALRHRQLSAEIATLDVQLDRLVAEAAPTLLALKGVGTETAACLLVAAGDNPERLRSEGAFAHLCGVAPIPASSGRTNRHRLNRGGNRAANCALYMLTLSRMAWEPRTREYVARRTAEGKTKPEIIRCLKRHIAREIYRAIKEAPSFSLPAADAA
ncbi:IS110 family transposase [Candidatus Nephthysia bennettiae]|uniref:IS110 family transposase n=1 Tax=Candidatus Nephthysia bennettiae TaxID=3127016 RepID=A0A934KD05_9BACT|nr:IS110 family transposase [Candidatus Dormibacteraeota bacterium]